LSSFYKSSLQTAANEDSLKLQIIFKGLETAHCNFIEPFLYGASAIIKILKKVVFVSSSDS